MAFIPTNKPHKNTEAEKMWTDLKGNRQRIYQTLYNELCKARVLIGLEECVIRV